MKKWFVVLLSVSVAAMVQAGEGSDKKKGEGKGGDLTKAQYVANMKKGAKKNGIEFDQAKAEAQFAKKDKNNDGVLSGDEKGKKKKKGKKKEKPVAE